MLAIIIFHKTLKYHCFKFMQHLLNTYLCFQEDPEINAYLLTLLSSKNEAPRNENQRYTNAHSAIYVLPGWLA